MALVKIKLCDADRERYEGLPEWVEFDLARPRLKHVKLLRQQVGMSWHELLQGTTVEDLEALGVVFWLAVRDAGHDVSWDDFDVDLAAEMTRGDDDPNSSAPDGAKPTSTPRRRTSPTSTGSSRGRSKS